MDNKLTRKYGLFTAICMVVGIVVGSGIFFKAQDILGATKGNLPIGVLAWVIGGVIMLVCLLAFSNMAQKYEKVNGIVDYSEALVGSRYAYYMGWFTTFIYLPAMTSVLAWVSARYTLVFLTSANPAIQLAIPVEQGGCIVGPECMCITMFYLCAAYVVNTISPKIAGIFQTSTTVIKFIPLVLMVVVGIIYGLVNEEHYLVQNFANNVVPEGDTFSNLLFAAVCTTAFAYEGWIIATSINAELRDAKRNLPIALVLGGIIIMTIYVGYNVGVAGGNTADNLVSEGATKSFTNIFGGFIGNVLNLFIAISCLGTLNGLMLASTRGIYALSARGEGPKAEIYSEVDDKSNMPNNSAVLGLLACAAWGVYF
ncbi:MAG: APC family permease, partial [Clostridia bacterium]|nr:APC family permease [Clostridia bacterium]